jgi:hypothetical protein
MYLLHRSSLVTGIWSFCSWLANWRLNQFAIRVQFLESTDAHRLNAALGWLGLDSPADARAELAAIPAAYQSHPAVLAVRWLLGAHEKNWAAALAAAEGEIAVLPTEAAGWLHRAYALRRVTGGGLDQAWDALLPAAKKFPKEPIIAYNLSCYACQMDKIVIARKWLTLAVKLGGTQVIRKMALADDDLKPLWREIKDW